MIKRIALLALFLGVSFAVALAPSAHAGATGFIAGRIIDDVIFTNTSTMSATDIQNFLNSKVPACDTYGTQMYNGSQTRAQFAASIGQYPPFTCIKSYSENGLSAAQIIYNAAQTYHINPQVLIVLLQKEQGLITDSWPYVTQYQKATGYGCPDTAACNSIYYGFTNQVTWAAKMYRAILNASPTWYTPYILGNNYIQYNPSASCGGSIVYIENRATQALYNYTPYQPNQATLNAGWGTAPCGAYGNRNFYLYFTSWFGGTLGVSYQASYSSQSAYPTVHQTESAQVTLRYANTGNNTWYDTTNAASKGTAPIVLATANPINRCSSFSTPSWVSCNRVARVFTHVYEQDGTTLAADQHSVMSGQIAEYTFTMTANEATPPSTYSEYFAPIREGAPDGSWYMGADYVHMNITVLDSYQASFVSQSPYPTLTQNERTIGYFKHKNTGVSTWYDAVGAAANNKSPVTLSTYSNSAFSGTWADKKTPIASFTHVYEADGTTLASDQHAVKPGQIVENRFWLTAPYGQATGQYREYFKLSHIGSNQGEIGGSATNLLVTVSPINMQASYASQNPYLSINRGDTAKMYYNLRNTGSSKWYDDAGWSPGILTVHFAATNPINRASPFYTSSNWKNSARPTVTFAAVYEADGVTLASDQHTVNPGQIAHFEFSLNTTLAAGTYTESFQPILEGAPGWSWNMGGTVWEPVTIH